MPHGPPFSPLRDAVAAGNGVVSARRAGWCNLVDDQEKAPSHEVSQLHSLLVMGGRRHEGVAPSIIKAG